ncbi:dihydrodipicolinate synthase family protein, partial [Rhizobium leguminosarum]
AEHKWDEVRALWKILEPSMGLIWEGDYVQSVYAAADLVGISAACFPRSPLLSLTAQKPGI